MSAEATQVAVIPPTDTDAIVQVIERAASNPNIDVEKLERLLAMQERIFNRNAESAFNAAMTACQSETGPIAADAENPQTRSMYASYTQLDKALRPVYTRNGFSISYDTADSPKTEHVRVLAYVAHVQGHTRTYRVDMPADGKGAKGGDVMTKTHASGAANSYGMRYLLKMIFNVAVGEDDNDGNERPKDEPEGYEQWSLDMEALADEGIDRLKDSWGKAKGEFKNYTMKKHAKWWDRIKAKASKVKHD